MPRKAGVITEEPTLRLALKETDFKELLDQLESDNWDHPVFWRMRSKWADHVRGRAAEATEAAADPTTKKAVSRRRAS
jgi:hypothetical protein